MQHRRDQYTLTKGIIFTVVVILVVVVVNIYWPW